MRQVETAALKSVGGNKYSPFDRRVTALYTAATLDANLRADKLGESVSSVLSSVDIYRDACTMKHNATAFASFCLTYSCVTNSIYAICIRDCSIWMTRAQSPSVCKLAFTISLAASASYSPESET